MTTTGPCERIANASCERIATALCTDVRTDELTKKNSPWDVFSPNASRAGGPFGVIASEARNGARLTDSTGRKCGHGIRRTA